MDSSNSVLELKNINKYFPDTHVRANDGIDLTVYPGEIHTLIGENGAGKSTLMHIAGGFLLPDSGAIFLNGTHVVFHSPKDALDHGIAVLYQHPMIIPELKVWENVVLGFEPCGVPGIISRQQAFEFTESLCKKYSISLDLEEKAGNLNTNQIQNMLILTALARDISVLVLDEPTTLLNDYEAGNLFNLLDTLKADGMTIILITHKLSTVLNHADRVSVLRSGRLLKTAPVSEVDEKELTELIIGDSLIDIKKSNNFHEFSPSDKKCLNISGLSLKLEDKYVLKDLTFFVRPGEVLGITGIRDEGIEVLENVFAGQYNTIEGNVTIHGQSVTDFSPGVLRKMGISYVPSNRLGRGSSINSSLEENLILLEHDRFHQFGLLALRKIDTFVRGLLSGFGIKGEAKHPLKQLSGGNIQKAILAREVAAQPELIFFADPGWGLDIKSKQFIYEKIGELKKQGTAVVLISSDIDEIIETVDTLIVLYQGQIAGKLEKNDFQRAAIGELMLGVKKE